MKRPEANVNARAYAYVVLREFLDLLKKRAEGCLDMKNDPCSLLWTVVEDTLSDFTADITEAEVRFSNNGMMSLHSDVLDFLDESDEIDHETLSITLSLILERLEGLEEQIRTSNGKSNTEH